MLINSAFCRAWKLAGDARFPHRPKAHTTWQHALAPLPHFCDRQPVKLPVGN
jgi:hypothetical protein